MRTHFFCIALVAGVIFHPSSSGAQSVALLAGHSLYIPFHLASGYLIVAEGTIGNSEHLKFVIDTGTVRTCIDRRLARQLGLSLEPHAVLRFDKMVRMNSTLLPSLTLGPMRAENFAVNVADLSHVGRSATQVSGIVGLDLLEPFPFQIDYEQMQIAFGPLPSLAESAAMDSVPWLPVVSVSFNRSNSRLLIDTGAHDIVLYYENLRGPTYNWKLLETEIWETPLAAWSRRAKQCSRARHLVPTVAITRSISFTRRSTARCQRSTAYCRRWLSGSGRSGSTSIATLSLGLAGKQVRVDSTDQRL